MRNPTFEPRYMQSKEVEPTPAPLPSPSRLQQIQPMEPYFEPHQSFRTPRAFGPEQPDPWKIDERYFTGLRATLHYPTPNPTSQPTAKRLPSISTLLAVSDLEPLSSGPRETPVVELQLPRPHPANILPIPQPALNTSAARYSLPVGEVLRSRAVPVSLSKTIFDIGSFLTHQTAGGIGKGHVSGGIRNHTDERQLAGSRAGMRHGNRQTMSDAEKRARKALQQQRRRKHGPTREPRERFSEEEDRWLVMEKTRLEREPNKHWTDLEYAHRARFPNLKDRTLSGLQSRYYRIKKKFPGDPQTTSEGETLSRWDQEVQHQFQESGDSDDPEDVSMDEESG